MEQITLAVCVNSSDDQRCCLFTSQEQFADGKDIESNGRRFFEWFKKNTSPAFRRGFLAGLGDCITFVFDKEEE